RFVEASFQLERRLLGEGTLLTSWTTSERQPSDAEGLNLDLGDLLCRFTACYGVQDLRLLYNLLFPEADQGAADDSPFWEGASGEALAAGLLLWGYDNALQSAGDRGMFSRILDRIPNLEDLLRQALSSREQTELVRSGAIPGISGELLAALSDPAVSLLPLWLAPEDGFRFNSIGNSIASAAALAATPGVLLDLYNLIERTSFDLDLCDLICAIDLLDGLPPLLADPVARATAATLLAENEALAGWFFDLAQAPSDRILRLDPRAWPILDAFDHGTLGQWQQLAELSPQVWTAIRRFDFDDYGRQVLEAIRVGDAPALAGLTSWDLSSLRCVLAGLALFTDAVADQLESSLLESATLAPLLSEAERQRYAASLSQPLRALQSGLLKMGPLLPQQLVQQLQLLLDQTINTPLGLTGNQRVVARGSLPTLADIPAGGGTAPHWLELDFSGLRTSVSLPLPIEALVSSALGVAPAGLPVLSAELTAQLQGGLRFGIDLATAVPSQALLLDTNGTLEAFDGTRAELLAGFSATLSLDPAYSPPEWLADINLAELVRLDGDAYLDLVRLGQDLELRGDAALSLRFARDGVAAELFERFSQAVSDQLSELDIGSPGACPAAWLAFVDRFIGLVTTLSGRVDQLPALPAWLPAEATAASRGLATGLRQVAGQLERFRFQVLDANNFVGLVNGLFADAGLSLRLRLLARPTNPEPGCCDQPPAELAPPSLLRSLDLTAPESSIGADGTLRLTLPAGLAADAQLEVHRLDAATLRDAGGSALAPFLNRAATAAGGQRLELQLADLDADSSTLDPGRFLVLVEGRTVIPERVSFKAGSNITTVVLELPAGTLRSGQSGLVSYLAPAGELELSRNGGTTWQPFKASETFRFINVPAAEGQPAEIQLRSGPQDVNVQLRLAGEAVPLQTIRGTYESGGYLLSEAERTLLRQQALPFAQLPGAQRRILITASTDDQGVSARLTARLTDEIAALAAAPAGSVNALLHTLLDRALHEWDTAVVPGEADGAQGDAANRLLAQARALSALQELLASGALHEADLQAAINRFHNPDGTERPPGELILGASAGSGLYLRLLPENEPGFTGRPAAQHRFVQVELELTPGSPVELLVRPPAPEGCDPALYIYELAFAEGAELDGRFGLDSGDLVRLLGGVSGDLARAVETALSLVDADLQGSFGLNLDVDGRLVFGYDARSTSFEQFLYVDTIGLDRPRADWPDGDPAAGHTLSFSVGDALDPTNAEITAQLLLQLEELVLSAGVPGLTEIR
ncbi:MAG: hypothetical protein VKN15_07620, partial [Cyanobacteriota bacterium]|nr:hypothetical protein [Cyanobacteriota bacterium]